jgi:hypothetical protein
MKIIEVAKKYNGFKEKPGNTGFIDKEHEKKMRAVGWVPGHAWCAYQIEAWFAEAYPERANELKSLMVPSAVNTHRNLVRAGYKSTMVPEVGAFVFWQRMKDGLGQWTGHAGLVIEVKDNVNFVSIEGNTNGAGSREGDGVYIKNRVVRKVEDGLQVIGFIKV